MGSPSLMIILILVVWIIVLAPLMIGNNKPIRRSGEGYEETRVLHEGGTAPMVERRRPKLTAADIHRHSEDDDYEVVEATDAEEDVLIDDAPALRTIFRRPGDTEDDSAADHVDGEVIDHVEDEAEAAAEEAGSADEVDAPDRADTATTEADAVPTGGSTKVAAASTGGSTSVKLLAEESATDDKTEADETKKADSADAEALTDEDRYELDESYTAPEDYGYADRETGFEPAAETHEDSAAVEAEADVVDGTAGQGLSALDESGEDTGDAGDAGDAGASQNASEEDIAFAASRRGRGGYDPERERKTTATRFQRRQRTLLGLIIACVITFVVAFVSGGWAWVLPAITVAMTAWFMIALRRVVLQERALQERRLRQLRRARMGVATGGAREHARDARLRAGSVVLELDDESPDFESLPSARVAPTHDDNPDGYRNPDGCRNSDGYGDLGGYGTRAS